MKNNLDQLSITELESQRDDVLERMNFLDEEILRINSQLRRAQTDLHKTGEYADPSWYNSAITAKQYKGKEKQELQQQLSLIKQVLKEKRKIKSQAKVVVDTDAFKKAAKILLREETFLKICELADTIKKGGIE